MTREQKEGNQMKETDQIAKAYGPNDECVQVNGLAFEVNVSAKLVAETINAAIEKALDEDRKTYLQPSRAARVSEQNHAVILAKHYIEKSHDTKRLLLEARRLLNKWAARYAEADHAKKDRDDSRKCIEAIDAAMSQEKK